MQNIIKIGKTHLKFSIYVIKFLTQSNDVILNFKHLFYISRGVVQCNCYQTNSEIQRLINLSDCVEHLFLAEGIITLIITAIYKHYYAAR